jgi:tRNA(Ile)-lysidine synthase
VGAAWVATGHTADDQAETVLHRLLRGAGLQGLRGVAARRTLAPGVTLLRPLLERTRAEVTTYLQCLGRPARIDTSNFDRRYTRNRIRHELLPLLTREYNPAVNRVLARLAAQADEAYREEAERAAALLVAAEHPSAGEVRVLARAPLIAAPRRLVRAAFRLLWEREGWPTAGMSYDAWERVAAVAFGETAGVDLPSGLRVRGRTNVIQVSRAV